MKHLLCLRFRFIIVMNISALMLSVTAPAGVAAGDLTAVWVPESGDRAVFALQDSDAEPSAETVRVGRSFYHFCCRWIGNKNGYALQNMSIQPADACRVREYSQCADAYEIRITKAPESPVYVGTLKYIEKLYREVGDASVQGRPGSFVVAAETPVTEFFMYSNGQWRY